MHLALEFSDTLRYKERTHWDENSDHLVVRNTRYGWSKRKMAKVSRRNGKVLIAEYDDEGFDLELYELLICWMAYVQWYDLWLFEQAMESLSGTYGCSGPGYCNFCDGKE